MVFVMSSTRSAAPLTGTSTATGAGMVGIAELGASVGVAEAAGGGVVAVGPVTPGIGVGDVAAGVAVQAATRKTAMSASWRRMSHPPRAKRANGKTKGTYVLSVVSDVPFGCFGGQRLLPLFQPAAFAFAS